MTHSVTLLGAYMRQRGLFARVAKHLRLDPSYVSRVANGERHSEIISLAIEADLNNMNVASRGIGKPSRRKSAHASS
jgi:hypothetical protein